MIYIKKDYNDIPKNLEKNQNIEGSTKYNSTDVKNKLFKIYNGKCGYCETIIDKSNSWATIDHYRPKKEYPFLCLEWSNLIYCCQKCNSCKHDKFPIELKDRQKDPKNKKDLLANSDYLKQENPYLLNPEIQPEKPEVNDFYKHLEFDNQGKIIGKTYEGEVSIDVLKLYRDELQIKRMNLICNTEIFLFLCLMIIFEEPDKEEITNLIPDNVDFYFDKEMLSVIMKLFDSKVNKFKILFDWFFKYNIDLKREFILLRKCMFYKFKEFFLNDRSITDKKRHTILEAYDEYLDDINQDNKANSSQNEISNNSHIEKKSVIMDNSYYENKKIINKLKYYISFSEKTVQNADKAERILTNNKKTVLRSDSSNEIASSDVFIAIYDENYKKNNCTELDKALNIKNKKKEFRIIIIVISNDDKKKLGIDEKYKNCCELYDESETGYPIVDDYTFVEVIQKVIKNET